MPDIFELIIVFLLGVIEGITEFLPVSSTGHIILLEKLLNYMDDPSQFFVLTIQLGAIIAVIIQFKHRLYKIIVNCFFYLFNRKLYVNHGLCMQHLLIGTIPGTLVGGLLYNKIKLLFLDPIYIMCGLIFGGILLLISEWYFIHSSLSSKITSIDNITYTQSFLIGCFQCLAFWPGFSRFGATIGGGLLLGLNRRAASEFSFFLAIPIISGSVILAIYHQQSNFNTINIIPIFIGFISALVSARITINFFLKIIRRISLFPFIIYRFFLAIVMYWWI